MDMLETHIIGNIWPCGPKPEMLKTARNVIKVLEGGTDSVERWDQAIDIAEDLKLWEFINEEAVDANASLLEELNNDA